MSTQDYEVDPAFAVAVTIIDSEQLPDVLGGDKFDVTVDPVGGLVRPQSLDLLAPSGRPLLIRNVSGDWDQGIDGNPKILRLITAFCTTL
ncbi:hypothetical protein ACQEV9_05420 [Streptomyces chartreusis]|uniref:hypothetical protein n=1 Tax=Streptomyces chartreusis TaxID=1969 RepID=UPI003D8D0844